MQRGFRIGLAIVGIALLFGGVAIAQDVKYNSMPGTDFSKYHTYKWVNIEGGAHPNQIMDAEIKQAVDAQLATKGLTKTTDENAELLVGYQIAVDKEKQWNAYGMGGGRFGGMGSATQSTINIGTLVLDMYDPGTKQLVWTGSATKSINPSSNEQKNEKNLNNAMAKLLKNYPPKSRRTMPLVASLIALACVFGGALLGMLCRRWVPDRHQGPDSKDVVRLAMGLVVTTSAIALGLLIGSAKSFFDTQNAEMAQIAANYVLMDRILANYGPEAADARDALRAELTHRVEESGRSGGGNRTYMTIKSGARMSETTLDTLKALSPKDDNQRFLKQQCLSLEVQLGQTRWLMYAQNTIPFPRFLLVMLIAWLTVLFVSFGMFAPRNPLVLAGLFASAAAVCGAILLILEMYEPQSGLIRISDAPLRAAYQVLINR